MGWVGVPVCRYLGQLLGDVECIVVLHLLSINFSITVQSSTCQAFQALNCQASALLDAVRAELMQHTSYCDRIGE